MLEVDRGSKRSALKTDAPPAGGKNVPTNTRADGDR